LQEKSEKETRRINAHLKKSFTNKKSQPYSAAACQEESFRIRPILIRPIHISNN
jgi:glycogen debranching enzyme